jgi:predicted ester cyclase
MKKLFIVLSLVFPIFVIFGCQDQVLKTELKEMKARAEIEEQNKEIAIRFYDEIDKQNFDAAIAMIAPDGKLYAQGGFEPAKRDDLKPMFPVWFSAFPDYAHQIQEVIAKGDKVVVRTTYTGTHQGDFFGVPPSGNSFKYFGIHML